MTGTAEGDEATATQRWRSGNETRSTAARRLRAGVGRLDRPPADAIGVERVDVPIVFTHTEFGAEVLRHRSDVAEVLTPTSFRIPASLGEALREGPCEVAALLEKAGAGFPRVSSRLRAAERPGPGIHPARWAERG